MTPRISFRLISLVVLLALSNEAVSCGDSMFRVGFGMEIPAGSVQQPADIVIFKSSNSGPDVFFDDGKVSAKLGKAGHRVHRVEGGTANASPEVEGASVILARADEVDRVRSLLSASVDKAVIVPVTEGFTKAVSGTGPSLSANATLQQILVVLQHALHPIAN